VTVNVSSIERAARVLEAYITRTPMLRDEALSLEFGASIHFKAECLQRGGSFKLRGAANKISSLTAEERARGVIAPSAGNHAQGVALAASLQGIKSTIVMPRYAPLTKVQATRAYGGEVILEGTSFDDAAAHARDLERSHGYTYVHAFDDPEVINGQGTVGLEILEQLPIVSTVIVPIGGGGLISGVATALHALKPGVRVIGVQAQACAPVRASLEAGETLTAAAAQTIADGIAVKRPGALTLPIIREHVAQIVEVSEDDIARAIVHCVQRAKLVVEGAGAAGLAALLSGQITLEPNETACVLLCGGNIDGNLLSRVIEQVMVRQGRYLMFKVTVVDRPGSLAQLVSRVAESGANVIDIFHRRALWLAPLGKVGVELVLEVRDLEHGEAVREHLEMHGYHVVREAQGDWVE
jgi:threonine dehydratase